MPVLCAWFLRKGVRERRNPGYEWIRGLYERTLSHALARPWVTIGLSTLVFVGSLLFIPHIGAEFMPKLDEGALWVRATMPYTISFEESSRIVPQVSNILRSFPDADMEEIRKDEVTTVTCEFCNTRYQFGSAELAGLAPA